MTGTGLGLFLTFITCGVVMGVYALTFEHIIDSLRYLATLTSLIMKDYPMSLISLYTRSTLPGWVEGIILRLFPY